MKICRYWMPGSGASIGLVEDGRVFDLGDADLAVSTISSLLVCADPAERIARARPQAVLGRSLPLVELDVPPRPDVPHLLAPVDEQEVWAAGVTYLRSLDARVAESAGGGSFYDRVYVADRPELFFKATPRRVAGPNAAVRIRRDARWSVPEPELALVIDASGRVAGFTIGNDMSARDIEGENPLYLPQAKIYRGSCAIGPAVLLACAVPDPKLLEIRLTIQRAGSVCFEARTSIARMKRGIEELADWLCREQEFPRGVVLLTGTGIVPPDTFTLQEGDVVEITVPEIGTLRNVVSEN